MAVISRSWLASCMWWSCSSGLASSSASAHGRPASRLARESSGSLIIRRTGTSQVCGSQGMPSAAHRWVMAPFDEPTPRPGKPGAGSARSATRPPSPLADRPAACGLTASAAIRSARHTERAS